MNHETNLAGELKEFNYNLKFIKKAIFLFQISSAMNNFISRLFILFHFVALPNIVSAQFESLAFPQESGKTEPVFQVQDNAPKRLGTSYRVTANADSVPLGQSFNYLNFLHHDPRILVDPITNSITFVRRAGISDNFGSRTQNMIVYDKSTDLGRTWTINEGLIYDISGHGGDSIAVRYPMSMLIRQNNDPSPDSVKYFTLGPATQIVRNKWSGRAFTLQNTKTVSAQQDRFRYQPIMKQYRITDICHSPKNGYTVEHQMPFDNDGGNVNARRFVKITTLKTNQIGNLVVKEDSIFMPTPDLKPNFRYSLMPPKIAFDPTGKFGYVVQLGYDTTRNPYQLYEPIISFTIDSGNHWSEPKSLDFNSGPSFKAFRDSIFGDSIRFADMQFPVRALYSSSFETGISVDQNGNLHLLFAFCVASETFTSSTSFGIHPGFKKLMGLAIVKPENYDYNQVRPISLGEFFGFRTKFNFLTATLDFHDNRLQVSRSKDGSKLTYSWLSTDTLDNDNQCTGCHSEPDIYAASSKVGTGSAYNLSSTRNYSKNTDCHGKMVFANISKDAIDLQGDSLLVPIVYMRFTSDSESASVQNYYTGIVKIPNNYPTQFFPSATIVGTEKLALNKVKFRVAPNPTKGKFSIFGLSNGEYDLSIIDLQGKQVVHQHFALTNQSVFHFEIKALPKGIYNCKISNTEGIHFVRLIFD